MAVLLLAVVLLQSAELPMAVLLTARRAVIQRISAVGRVKNADCVASGGGAVKRSPTMAVLLGAGCKTEERILALSGVGVRIASDRWRAHRSRYWRKRKAGKRECDENQREG